MGKRQISKIILLETILVGIISLAIGIIIGVFASQFMSVLIAKLFEANMSEFTFVFSKNACIKTCVYFAIMYVAVAIFNTITISRYKLINLLTSLKKNEKVKIKNPVLCVVIFFVASIVLGYAYWKVTGGVQTMDTAEKMLPVILMGIVSTILLFWSLSGFVLHLIKSIKNVYLKGTNMFVLRQINNKINTMVVSMSVICLMLFMTISILSSSLSLRNCMQKDLIEMTPVDINLYKEANLPERAIDSYGKENVYTKMQQEDSKVTIQETLKENGLDMDVLKDIVEISMYTDERLTMGTFLESAIEEIKAQYPMLAYDTPEQIVKISDYNKLAKLYGTKQYELNDNEYIMLCDFKTMEELRNKSLKNKDNPLTIAGKQYDSKYESCQEGFIDMSSSHVNIGIMVVPDNCPLQEENKVRHFLAANYNGKTDEEKEKIEAIFDNSSNSFVQNLENKGIKLDRYVEN